MSVHIPESPLKYGHFGLFSFLGRVCIFSLHTGVQTILHTGVRQYAHGCAGSRVCTKKPDGYVPSGRFFMPSCHDRASLPVPSRGEHQCKPEFSRCPQPVR